MLGLVIFPFFYTFCICNNQSLVYDFLGTLNIKQKTLLSKQEQNVNQLMVLFCTSSIHFVLPIYDSICEQFFSHVRKISCFPGFNQFKADDNVSCSRKQCSDVFFLVQQLQVFQGHFPLNPNTRFIQASLCKIQGLFKDF